MMQSKSRMCRTPHETAQTQLKGRRHRGYLSEFLILILLLLSSTQRVYTSDFKSRIGDRGFGSEIVRIVHDHQPDPLNNNAKTRKPKGYLTQWILRAG